MAWSLIGFEGPKSLKATMDGSYSTDQFFDHASTWGDLIPYLSQQSQWEIPE